MTKVILFDFDGTIADSYECFLKTIHILSEKHHLPILPREELERYRVLGAKALIKRLKIPLYKMPFIGRDYKKIHNENFPDLNTFKNLPAVLRELKKREYVLGILTSNSRQNIQKFITYNNLDIFEYIYCDSSIFGKSIILKRFLKHHKIEKEDVMYVGDEIRDIQASQKVGIKVIAVAWGYSAKEGLKPYNPDYLIDKPEDLLTIAK